MNNIIKNSNDLKHTLDRIGRPIEVKIYRRGTQNDIDVYDLEYLLNIAKTQNCIARLEYYNLKYHNMTSIDISPTDDIDVYKRLFNLV